MTNNQSVPPQSEHSDTTHFGFQTVGTAEKQKMVKEVFDSVTDKYDVMNDLMSFGLHRLWKNIGTFIINPPSDGTVLDLAGGTGDITARLAKRISTGSIVLSDINESMLRKGIARLTDEGIADSRIRYCVANAETLPFQDNQFDLVTMAFGLRNVTDKQQALNEIHRVLKPGGQAAILEFSKVNNALVNRMYQQFSFKIIPKIGKLIADDEDSYRYLAESIKKHPNQETLKSMMEQAGLRNTSYLNLSMGIVALHRGFKIGHS